MKFETDPMQWPTLPEGAIIYDLEVMLSDRIEALTRTAHQARYPALTRLQIEAVSALLEEVARYSAHELATTTGAASRYRSLTERFPPSRPTPSPRLSI